MTSLYVRGRELETTFSNRAMKVRFVHGYEVTNQWYTYECLFHDEEGTFVHCTVPKEFKEKYRGRMIEGKVYTIRNFVVVENNLPYKTSVLELRMKFYHKTEIYDYVKGDFLNKQFRLKSFEELQSPSGADENVLIDLIGRVVEINFPLDVMSRGNPARVINFTYH